MATGINLSTAHAIRATDSNGDAVSGAKLTVYKAGTATSVTTYSDEALTTANASPVVADSSGAFGAIYLAEQDVKVDITDSGGTSLPGYPVDDIPLRGVSKAREIATRAAILTTDVASTIDYIRTAGYATVGDGGEGLYDRVASEPAHPFKAQSNDTAWWELVASGPVSAKQAGATGDGATDDATALADWLTSEDIGRDLFLPQGTYLTGTALTATDNPQRLIGGGWQRDKSGAATGTILKASATSVTDLLTIKSADPATAGNDREGLVLADFAMIHRGGGVGLLIDDMMRARVRNLYIDCNAGDGAIGMKIDTFGFFATIDGCAVHQFSDVGILIDGSGSEHIVRDCHVLSGEDTATAGLKIQRNNFSVIGGQYNVNRADDTGIGILVWNDDASNARYGGVIKDVIAEADVGIAIDGDSQSFNEISVMNTFFNLGTVTTGVHFKRAAYCTLDDPQVVAPSGGGNLVIWGANSIECGLECDYFAATAAISVVAGATRPWKHVKGFVSYSNRANIKVDSDAGGHKLLVTTVENVEDIGRCVHNGTAWDKHKLTIANEAATSETLPVDDGLIVEVRTDTLGEVAIAQYTTTGSTMMEKIYEGSNAAIMTSDGTLGGTTGTAAKINIRIDKANKLLYIENQVGASREVYVTFRQQS